MRRIVAGIVAAFVALPVFAAEEPKAEEQKTLYAVGLVIARQLGVFDLTAEELELVKQGVTDGVTGKTALRDSEAYALKMQQLAATRRAARGTKLAPEGKEFLEKAAMEKGAVKTKSGMVFLPLKEGTGKGPTIEDRVKVNFRASLIDGSEFDSSYGRGKPAELPVVGGVKCWTEGLLMMKPGGKARLACPPDRGYGDKSTGLIPANATLVFEVELLEVMK